MFSLSLTAKPRLTRGWREVFAKVSVFPPSRVVSSMLSMLSLLSLFFKTLVLAYFYHRQALAAVFNIQ
jgi:hypothetical protein